MIQEWKAFLLQAGAVFDGDRIHHFGRPQEELAAATTGTLITDLSPWGLIAVKGKDAVTFLQNLLTNDVREVSPSYSQLTGLCNPKGRLLALFRLWQWGEDFYLTLPQNLLEMILKRLTMYVLRSQVTLREASDQFCRIGLAGVQAVEELKQVLGRVPAKVNDVQQTAEICIIRVPGEPPRFEMIGELKSIQQLWCNLSKAATPGGSGPWELLNLRAGIPTIYPETLEAFIPQQVNLELRNGVSFTKGCYPGQEVIARMHYRGKPSRRMFLGHSEGNDQPLPGEPVYLAEGEEAHSVGQIVAAQRVPEGGYDSLVVLQLTSLGKGPLTVGGHSGPELILRELPYEVPTQ
jgi:tRNA-modifying protein YgfZ